MATDSSGMNVSAPAKGLHMASPPALPMGEVDCYITLPPPTHSGGFRKSIGAGWSSPVARQAHNLKVVGSNPTPATNFSVQAKRFSGHWASAQLAAVARYGRSGASISDHRPRG